MNKAMFNALSLCGLCLLPLLAVNTSTAQTENDLETLQQQARKWFKSPDVKARRSQMREMTRALRRPCKYCHDAGFEGYTDKYQVSLEMMVLSNENDVGCADCHAGKHELTEMGKKAEQMAEVSQQLHVSCNHCHVQKAQFKKLTVAGEHYRATSMPIPNDARRIDNGLEKRGNPPVPVNLNKSPTENQIHP